MKTIYFGTEIANDVRSRILFQRKQKQIKIFLEVEPART